MQINTAREACAKRLACRLMFYCNAEVLATAYPCVIAKICKRCSKSQRTCMLLAKLPSAGNIHCCCRTRNCMLGIVTEPRPRSEKWVFWSWQAFPDAGRRVCLPLSAGRPSQVPVPSELPAFVVPFQLCYHLPPCPHLGTVLCWQ